jgi:hypothetical protein
MRLGTQTSSLAWEFGGERTTQIPHPLMLSFAVPTGTSALPAALEFAS